MKFFVFKFVNYDLNVECKFCHSAKSSWQLLCNITVKILAFIFLEVFLENGRWIYQSNRNFQKCLIKVLHKIGINN
jgi:hypothetical protein